MIIKIARWICAACCVGGVVLVGLFATSCVLPGYSGFRLLVNGEGHFFSDVTYNFSGFTDIDKKVTVTFNADGSFEKKTEKYEGKDEDEDGDGETTEGWVMISGQKGTYLYEPRTFIFETVVNETVSRGEWNHANYSETDNLFFAEKTYYRVYSASNTDIDTWEYRYEQNGGSGTYTYADSRTVNTDEKTYSNYTEILATGNDGVVIYGYATDISGSYTLYPAGEEFSGGGTKTLAVDCTITARIYDASAQRWGEWSEGEKYVDSWEIIHMGDYLLSEEWGDTIPGASRRIGLEGQF